MEELFGFSKAFELAEQGYKIGNKDWEAEDYIPYLKVCYPQSFAFIGMPYLYKNDPELGVFPWTPDQIDMFSKNYYIIEYSTEESY